MPVMTKSTRLTNAQNRGTAISFIGRDGQNWASSVKAGSPRSGRKAGTLKNRSTRSGSRFSKDQAQLISAFRAMSNDKRLLILEWLKAPREHFREQVEGDLVNDGVCGLLLAEKLGIAQPTLSEHMRILVQAELVRAKRIKQWTFYRRDESTIDRLITDIKQRL